MSKIVQWKRGNVAVNDAYTGYEGEITVDTSSWNLRIHDGTTAGGYQMLSSQAGAAFANISVNNTATFYNLTANGNITLDSLTIDNRSIISPAGNLTLDTPGSVRSNTFFANNSITVDATTQLGYLFANSGGSGITGFTHRTENGTTLLEIIHDNNSTVKFYDSNTVVITGNLEVTQTPGAGTILPNAFMTVAANVDSYLQSTLQNFSSDSFASGDFVVTADDGSDESWYIDMGMASSTYNIEGFEVVGPHDGYLYVAGQSYLGPVNGTANLNLGSTTGSIRTWIGQGTLSNVKTTVSETGFSVNGNLTVSSTSTLQKIEEKFATLTGAIGNVNHDCNNGHIFYQTAPFANWIADFTNLNLSQEYATTLTVIVSQGATPFIPNIVNIEGAAQTINWQGNTEPTGTANGKDKIQFNVLNDGGTYIVLGELTGFGG